MTREYKKKHSQNRLYRAHLRLQLCALLLLLDTLPLRHLLLLLQLFLQTYITEGKIQHKFHKDQSELIWFW